MFISSLVEFLRLPIFSPAKWASLSLLTVAPSSRRARRFGARMGAARMIPGDHARSLCGDFLPAQRPMPSTAIRIENSIALTAYQDNSDSYNRKSVRCRRAHAITAPFSRFWLHLLGQQPFTTIVICIAETQLILPIRFEFDAVQVCKNAGQ